MSSTYNLNEQAGQDYFEFTLDDFKYKMAYPSTNDLLQLQELTKSGETLGAKVEELQEKAIADPSNEEVAKELQDAIEQANVAQGSFIDWCMKYVTPDDPAAPDVKQALLTKSVKYVLAFSHMVETELS